MWVLDDLGVEHLLLQSPGNLRNELHIQGVYLLVKHPPTPTIRLPRLWARWRKTCGINDEVCWQSKYRLVRLPVQVFMRVLDSQTLQPLHPDESGVELFEHTISGWIGPKEASEEDFLRDRFGHPGGRHHK